MTTLGENRLKGIDYGTQSKSMDEQRSVLILNTKCTTDLLIVLALAAMKINIPLKHVVSE